MSGLEAPEARVAVVVPTLGRPESLARALRSLSTQVGVHGRLESIVVVDNDPAASARETCAALAAKHALPIRYVREPAPGVATARNAGLRATDARLIAFLDDDEAAQPGWLAALLDAHAHFGADVVFGPVRGCAPDADPKLQAWLERFFSRNGPAMSGLIDATFGCGNSLLDRGLGRVAPEPFRVTQDETGGEDDVLFAAIRAAGGRFAWAAEAWVQEYAPPHRARAAYALRRAFAHGQSPCQARARQGRRSAIPALMIMGAMQATALTIMGALAWALGLSSAWPLFERGARGAGKLFWFRCFEPRFYGASEVRRLTRAQSRLRNPAPAAR